MALRLDIRLAQAIAVALGCLYSPALLTRADASAPVPTAIKVAAPLDQPAVSNLPLAPAEIRPVAPPVEPPAPKPAPAAANPPLVIPSAKIVLTPTPQPIPVATAPGPQSAKVLAAPSPPPEATRSLATPVAAVAERRPPALPEVESPSLQFTPPPLVPPRAFAQAVENPSPDPVLPLHLATTTLRQPRLREPLIANPPAAPAEALPIPSSPPLPLAETRTPAIDEERPIASLTTTIAPPDGDLPADPARQRFAQGAEAWETRAWEEVVYSWDAPGLCYRPLRYEQVNVERYGYSHCPLLQPALSGAHFFCATLALPYSMTVHPHGECIYPLGHYRPGSCVPYRHQWPEHNVRAGAVETGAVAGLILLIP